jgi:hypothetical protein
MQLPNRRAELLATPDPATSLAARAMRRPTTPGLLSRQLPPDDVVGFEVSII